MADKAKPAAPAAAAAPEEPAVELTFEGISSLVVKYLSPVEQLSPFKIGQIQKLIADIAASAGNSELGGQIAPYFAVAQVVFLLLFVAYFVIGVVALAVDAEAMDAECATDSWIWLYSLLVVVIPTSIGFVLGLVQSGLQLLALDATYMKYADGFLVLPGPILFVTLGILGIVLWGGMTDECDVFYAENHGLLLGVFHLQVIIMSVASIFGLMALFGTIAAIWADVSAGYTKIDDGAKNV